MFGTSFVGIKGFSVVLIEGSLMEGPSVCVEIDVVLTSTEIDFLFNFLMTFKMSHSMKNG